VLIHTIAQGKSRAAAFLSQSRASGYMCAVKLGEETESRGNFSAETMTDLCQLSL